MAAEVLLVASWFGLVTGLLEGAEFLVFQKLGRITYVSLEIIWISAFFNLLLFSTMGLILIAVAYPFSQLPIRRVLVLVSAFLAFLSWLTIALTEYINHYALVILAMGLAVQFTRWFRKHEATALRFWGKSISWIIAMALLALICIQGGIWLREQMATTNLPMTLPGLPNVLVIVVDALRADHLSSYGYTRPTSPNIDRLAQQGVLFEHAFSTASWTLPSHASLLTGLYPSEHGVGWQSPKALLNCRCFTLAEALFAHGYRTAAFSANVFWFTHEFGFSRGFIHFEDYFDSIGNMVLRTLYGRVIENFVLQGLGFEDIPARKRASEINRAVLHWIDRDRERPFFAFLNYMDTHDPYLPPSYYRTMFASMQSPGGVLNWRVGRHHLKSPEQLQGEIDAYDGAIVYVDTHVNQLLTELQKRHLTANTFIVLTSDHGEAFGEHGSYLHGNSLYYEETHVPLIFWWPGRVPAGLRMEHPVTNAALSATVMDLIGMPAQTLFPGLSLAKLWETAEGHVHWPYLLTEMEEIPWGRKESPAYHGSIKSLVSPLWHFIMHEKLGIELYDWKNDPQELHNLVERPASCSDVTGLWSKLWAISYNRQITTAEPLPTCN